VNRDWLKQLLEKVAARDLTVEEALTSLKTLPYEDLDFAKLDHHRGLRDVFPEVIFCPGKTAEQTAVLVKKLADAGNNVLATRATPEVFTAVSMVVPDAEFHSLARIITVTGQQPAFPCGEVAVVTAGTSDIPVAEEAAVSLEVMGARVLRIYDVGVAGIHRLLDRIEEINRAQVVIAIAGMEGALASVVGGLTSRPVIAVPTSVGYGANFGGLSALLSMLNTCATGVGVVNIDNGFGAAALAFSILKCRDDQVGIISPPGA